MDRWEDDGGATAKLPKHHQEVELTEHDAEVLLRIANDPDPKRVGRLKIKPRHIPIREGP